jgi:hypothetical protein
MPLTQVSPGLLDSNAQYYGMKSRIINGAMVIDQRNNGASITPTDGQYSVDRWRCYLSAASKYSAQQNAGSVTPPAGFSNYLGATSLSAYSVTSSDYFFLQQRIEGFNFADMAWGTANAQTITLSFWVRSSLTGTFGGSLQNSAADRSYPFTYSISSANTWEQKTVTIAGDTSGTWVGATNGIGVSVIFSLGMGSTRSGTAGAWAASNFYSATGATSVVGTNGATFYITGVQLEKGSTATSFDYRPYGTELALCQRYARPFGAGCTGRTASSTVAEVVQVINPPMRANPTVSFGGFSGAGNTVNQLSVATFTITSIGATNVFTNSVYATLNGTGGSTGAFIGNASGGDFGFLSAEL